MRAVPRTNDVLLCQMQLAVSSMTTFGLRGRNALMAFNRVVLPVLVPPLIRLVIVDGLADGPEHVLSQHRPAAPPPQESVLKLADRERRPPDCRRNTAATRDPSGRRASGWAAPQRCRRQWRADILDGDAQVAFVRRNRRPWKHAARSTNACAPFTMISLTSDP